MGATAKYGLRYPDLTDPPHGPQELQNLAEDTEAALDGVVATIPTDGWNASGDVWTFGAADAPTYTMTTPGDRTASVEPGMRVRLTQAATVRYFIVTAVAFAAGITTVTMYGGTDYTLAAGAITAVSTSRAKKPAGFPTSPAKWTHEARSSSLQSVSSPANGAWYPQLSLVVPVGVWRLSFQALLEAENPNLTGNYTVQAYCALSALNNGVSDPDLKGWAFNYGYVSAAQGAHAAPQFAQKVVALAAKTTYYLVFGGDTSPLYIYFRGDLRTTIIRAECAYL